MNEWVIDPATTARRPAKGVALPRAPESAKPAPVTSVTDTRAVCAPTLQAPAAISTSGKAVVTALIIYCLLTGLVFYDTLASMVWIWFRSQTFAHGFLIAPISLWLAWRMKHNFSDLNVRPEPRALILVMAAGLAWLLGYLVDVQVIQHLAFVSILICGIWAIVGTEVARSYAFPLGFLFMAVPMGAGLIPPLMEFTADTTEFLLRVSGIPVFREGMYLSIPTGTWSVIEECSGVRYLIASLTLGLVYAKLTYTSLRRRLAFVVAAIVAPILANSLRAYGVVMVGHLSNMRYGIGADHLIYGWVFFGLVMLAMFWIGGIWQQHPDSPSPSDSPSTASAASPEASQRQKPALSLTLGTGLALLCASTWPAVAAGMNRNTDAPINAAALTLPAALGTWQAEDDADWHWQPGQPGADRQIDQVYTTSPPESLIVGLHIRQYLQQHQGAELVTSTDPFRPDRKAWRVIEQGRTSINLGSALEIVLEVDEVRVVSAQQNLLLWSWYHIDGRNTANAYIAKLLESRQRIVEGRRQGTRVFIATPLGEDPAQARQALQEFVSAYGAAIEASLQQGIREKDITEQDFTSTENAAGQTPAAGAIQ